MIYIDKACLRRALIKPHGRAVSAGGAPALLYEGRGGTVFDVHGGGYDYGSHLDEDGYCRYLHEKTGYTVLSCSYPLSHTGAKFPKQVETVYAAVKAFSAGAPLMLVGHSAGANCAAAVALLAQERGEFELSALVLNYPVLDLFTDPSERPRVKGSTLSDGLLRKFNERLFARREDARSPVASPLFSAAEQLARFPRTYICVCGKDVLRADGLAFYEKLKRAGGEAVLSDVPAFHGFIEEGMRSYGSYRTKKQKTARAETDAMLAWLTRDGV